MLRLASLTSAVLLVGCANQGDEGMIVTSNTAIPGEECALTGDPNQPFISSGQIYALSPMGYVMSPLIQSRVAINPSAGGVMTGGPGGGGMAVIDELQRTIQLRGADVKLTLKSKTTETGGAYSVDSTESVLDEFGVLFSGSLPPEGSVNVFFEAITPAQMRNLVSGINLGTTSVQAQVLAEVTIRGEMGGSEVLATPFYYPINVCTNCVVVNNGACPMIIDQARTGNACNPFQDGLVDCCTDASNNLICPGPTATAVR